MFHEQCHCLASWSHGECLGGKFAIVKGSCQQLVAGVSRHEISCSSEPLLRISCTQVFDRVNIFVRLECS